MWPVLRLIIYLQWFPISLFAHNSGRWSENIGFHYSLRLSLRREFLFFYCYERIRIAVVILRRKKDNEPLREKRYLNFSTQKVSPWRLINWNRFRVFSISETIYTAAKMSKGKCDSADSLLCVLFLSHFVSSPLKNHFQMEWFHDTSLSRCNHIPVWNWNFSFGKIPYDVLICSYLIKRDFKLP